MTGTTLLSGCYSYTRYDMASAMGAMGATGATGATGTSPQLALDISDHGRVQLADRLGPGVVRIEGRLTGVTPEAYELSVTSVRYLRGDPVKWSGEPLTVPREAVASSYERRFSRTRTITTAAVIVGGAAALLLGTDLVGIGSTDPGTKPTPGPPSNQ